MKKTKILLPILSVAGVAAACTPLVMLTSCNDNNKNIPITQIKIEKTGQEESYGLGIGGSFEKGTNYIFNGSMGSWTQDKPDSTTWDALKEVVVVVSRKGTAKVELVDTLNVVITADNSVCEYTYEYSDKFNAGIFTIK